MAENPFCKALPVEKGEVFFLLIDDYSRHSTGFRLHFNEVVLQCDNPKSDFLQ